MWKFVAFAFLAAVIVAFPADETELVLNSGSTTGPHYDVVGLNSSDKDESNKTDTTETTTLPDTTTPPRVAKIIETCDQTICEERICRVNGSISRPSFYARCPSPVQLENDQDLSKYCMCASAYHAAPLLTESGEAARPSYVTITPDINCDVPISDLEKSSCEQEKCQGVSKKANRLAHICQVDDKYYCACFN